jgi:endonuclease YncB( thermonuclease family)
MRRALPAAALMVLMTGGALADAPAAPRPIKGAALVIDGENFELAGDTVALWGVATPPAASDAGQHARRALEAALARDPWVDCRPKERDRYGRLLARCFLANGDDLASVMVWSGFAMDWPSFSKGFYGRLQTAARGEGSGPMSTSPGCASPPW